MTQKPIFNLLKKNFKFFLKKYKIEGLDNIPSEPSILIGNHSHSSGPIFAEMFFPLKNQTWCTHQLMSLKTAPSYMQEDFWKLKPKHMQWFFKILSYVCSPFCVYAFKNANTIPVYKDHRGIITFKQTLKALENGYHIIIFPEGKNKYNHILNDFQDKFIDTAKIYYKNTGKTVNFVPFYLAPTLHKAVFGKPIKYNSSTNIDIQRTQICNYLKTEITSLACNLPLHTVVPYENIPKKLYPKNKSTTS